MTSRPRYLQNTLPSKQSKTTYIKKAPSMPACPAAAAPYLQFSGSNYIPILPLAAPSSFFSITSSFWMVLSAFLTLMPDLPKLQLTESMA